MTGKEQAFFDKDSIQISRDNMSRIKDYVMHSAETSLMHSLADLVTSNGGNILELGFGMGISANRVQQNPNVTSHTIVEIHPEIHKRALDWAKDKPNVKILFGDWIDVVPSIHDTKFHGVLHDTFSDRNVGKLIDLVTPMCYRGCIIGFFLNYENQNLKSLKHKFTEEEIASLPYKLPINKITNEYSLRYTIVD